MEERNDGGFELNELTGTRLTAICLVGLVRLEFGEDREIHLNIERDFTVRSEAKPDGTFVEFRPFLENWSPSGMTELVLLFRAEVTSALAESDATLRIYFKDGRSLEVLPDPLYEGWTMSAAGQLLGQVAGDGLFYFPSS